MIFAIIGWMIGLGFFNYPLARMLGRPATLREREEHGAWRYFRLCTDHKVVAIQYLVAVLFFFFVAGLNAMFIRTELTSVQRDADPGRQLPDARRPARHDDADDDVGRRARAARQLPRADHDRRAPHGLPADRVADDVADRARRLRAAVGDAARRLPDRLDRATRRWPTRRAPGSTPTSCRSLIGISLALVGVNIITTVITLRAPGMTWNRLPIFVWGMVTTSILAVLAAPVLARR
jgi:cytochrome c oxidase subunit 1